MYLRIYSIIFEIIAQRIQYDTTSIAGIHQISVDELLNDAVFCDVLTEQKVSALFAADVLHPFYGFDVMRHRTVQASKSSFLISAQRREVAFQLVFGPCDQHIIVLRIIQRDRDRDDMIDFCICLIFDDPVKIKRLQSISALAILLLIQTDLQLCLPIDFFRIQTSIAQQLIDLFISAFEIFLPLLDIFPMFAGILFARHLHHDRIEFTIDPAELIDHFKRFMLSSSGYRRKNGLIISRDVLFPFVRFALLIKQLHLVQKLHLIPIGLVHLLIQHPQRLERKGMIPCDPRQFRKRFDHR